MSSNLEQIIVASKVTVSRDVPGPVAGPTGLLAPDLIADYVHKLRTPLVAVRGYTKMVLDQRVGALNDTQQEYLQIVADSAQRIVRLLDDLSAEILAAEQLSSLPGVGPTADLAAGAIPFVGAQTVAPSKATDSACQAIPVPSPIES